MVHRLNFLAPACSCFLLLGLGLNHASALERRSEFELIDTIYLGGVRPTNNQKSNYPNLNTRLILDEISSYLEFRFHIEAGLALNNAAFHYFDLPEAYLGTSRAWSPLQIHAGRKLEPWSKIDDVWFQGYFQPRTRWEYFDPDPAGLLGLFGSYREPGIEAVLFASPIFVPEQRACAINADGTFNVDSPWCVPVDETANFKGQKARIAYRIDTPPVTSLVAHPGVAARLRVGKRLGPWVQTAYAFKPMNQLLIGIDAPYATENERVETIIYPRVVYHQLVSNEVGYEGDTWGASMSGLYERPIRDHTNSNWTTEEIGPVVAVSPMGWVKPFGLGRHDPKLSLAYLRQLGGPEPDQGKLAAGKGSFFETRMMYREAVRADVQTGFPWRWARPIATRLSLIRDLNIEATHVSTEIAYVSPNSWTARVGADFIGVEQTDRTVFETQEPQFLNRYKANDRVLVGVSYAF